jgi:hypothetical protein
VTITGGASFGSHDLVYAWDSKSALTIEGTAPKFDDWDSVYATGDSTVTVDDGNFGNHDSIFATDESQVTLDGSRFGDGDTAYASCDSTLRVEDSCFGSGFSVSATDGGDLTVLNAAFKDAGWVQLQGGAATIDGTAACIRGGVLDFMTAVGLTELDFDNGRGTDYGEAIFGDANGLDVTVNGFAGTKPNLANSDGIELAGVWCVQSETSCDGTLTLTLRDGCETATFNFDDFDGKLHIADVDGNTVITDPAVSTVASTSSVSVGGPGNDTFVFSPGVGAETISNFNPQADTIELDHFASVQNTQQLAAAITADPHGDAVIELGHGDSVTIPGVSVSYLEQHLQSLVHLH